MIEIQQCAQEMNNSFVNQNNRDNLSDAFVLGALFNKSQDQGYNTFYSILNQIIKMRGLIDAQLYDNNQLINIYNKSLFGQDDFYKLCQDVENQTFASLDNENKSKILQFQQNKSIINPYGNMQYQQYQSQLQQFQQLKQGQSKIKIIQIINKNESEDLKQSQQLAEQLQHQYDMEYSQQLNEDQQQVKCTICLEDIPFNEIVALNCNHMFHQKCLHQFCTVRVNDRQFPIPCPECNKQIIQSDLNEILDGQTLIDFQQYTFKAYVEQHGEEYSWCPTPDCQYVFVQNNDNSEFQCPICQKHYCLNCKVEFHIGLSCQQYREKIQMEKNLKNEAYLDNEFEKFVKGQKYKQCPQCKFWVEKSQGCNHMTCRCKFEFCYVCGGVYQKCACVRARRI